MDDGGSEHGGNGGMAGSDNCWQGREVVERRPPAWAAWAENTTTGVGGTGGKTGGGTGGAAGNAAAVDAAAPDVPMDVAVDRPALDAPHETGGSLLANGASCSSGSQCQNNNCVDSVCCESACSGQCQSCGEADSLGKCVTVTGAVRGQIRASCTGNGMCAASCNGTDPAQCHYPGSEKQCADPTCTAGVAHAAAKCDGAGNCPAGAMTNCDPFLCGATACKTTCATSADCTTASYCAVPKCVAKKALGAVCGAGEQCTTGICGGRCCTAPCTCPQPTAGNLFKNAGFDSDVSSWDRLKSSVGSDHRHSMEQPGCRRVSVFRLGSRDNVWPGQSVSMRGRHGGDDVHLRRLVSESGRQSLYLRDAVLVWAELHRHLDLRCGTRWQRDSVDISLHAIHLARWLRELQPGLRIQHQ